MSTDDVVVPAISAFEVDPEAFEAEEVVYAYYLAHLSSLANAVILPASAEASAGGYGAELEAGLSAEDLGASPLRQTGAKPRGFIDAPLWRRPKDNEPYNARIIENHASLSFFYTADRPWNVYRGHAALRARLEAVLAFWCASQNPDGRFSEYGPENWSLAPTGFGVKFMGQTLRALKTSEASGGPTIDAALLQRTADGVRKAIETLLGHPDLLRHARQYSNQYTGAWGGTMAYLSVYPDADLERRFGEVVETFGEESTSPVGYHYERRACDWRYTMGTHRNNVRDVFRFAKGSALGDRIVAMETPWMHWLSFNAVPEPDFSYFTMNRAIETRTALPGYATWETAVGEAIPVTHAYSQTQSEYAGQLGEAKAELVRTWGPASAEASAGRRATWEGSEAAKAAARAEMTGAAAVPPSPRLRRAGSPPLTLEARKVGVGPLENYSPHIFVDGHPSLDWRPTETQRDAARKTLPMVASERFTHLRVDDREAVQFTFVRRPTYYAAFNSGEIIHEMQKYGLGLLWGPEVGAVVQAQSKDLGAWGTAHSASASAEASADRQGAGLGEAGGVVEAGGIEADILVGGEKVEVVPGCHDLEDADVEISYGIGDSGRKVVTFGEEGIEVAVEVEGPVTEHFPLLVKDGDLVKAEGNSLRLERGGKAFVVDCGGEVEIEAGATEVAHGPFVLWMGTVRSDGGLRYTMRFEA